MLKITNPIIHLATFIGQKYNKNDKSLVIYRFKKSIKVLFLRKKCYILQIKKPYIKDFQL